MGNRANFVIVKDQDWQLYYSHWGGCRMLDALIGGPELALRYAASLRRCDKDEWCDPTWADGGAVVDLDRRRVLFFGEPLMVEMNERRALTEVLATVWPGYEVRWAYDGTAELAGYVGAELRPCRWDRQPTLKLARGRKHLCHLISVVDADGQLRFWPLWWHLSKAWHGPALLDELPGPGIRRIRLGKIPEGGAHIDLRRKTLGAWQTADTMGFFQALPELWPGWRTEVWEDRFEEHVKRCDGALRVPELDVVAGIDSAEAWLRKRVFESFEDSPAGQSSNLRGCWRQLRRASWSAPMLERLRGSPGTEWSRFVGACHQLRSAMRLRLATPRASAFDDGSQKITRAGVGALIASRMVPGSVVDMRRGVGEGEISGVLVRTHQIAAFDGH